MSARVVLLAGACVVLLTCCACRAGAVEFPCLEGPALYAGERAVGKKAVRVLLRLEASGDFILREETTCAVGGPSITETVGLWRQIRSGTLLQLSNAGGLSRTLNVGGTGDIYLGLNLPGGERVTVPLRRRIVSGGQSPPAASPGLPGPVPECFWDAVIGSRWMLVRVGDVAFSDRVTLEFGPEREGRLVLCEGADCAPGGYMRCGERLSLSASANDLRLADVIRRARLWRLVGDVLELWDDARPLAVLEREW